MRLERRLGYETEERRLHAHACRLRPQRTSLVWSGLMMEYVPKVRSSCHFNTGICLGDVCASLTFLLSFIHLFLSRISYSHVAMCLNLLKFLFLVLNFRKNGNMKIIIMSTLLQTLRKSLISKYVIQHILKQTELPFLGLGISDNRSVVLLQNCALREIQNC